MELFDIDWNIYPNPVNDKTTITYKLNNPNKVKINVIDELGKKIKSTGYYNGVQGFNTLVLDLITLKSGIYFVSITVDGEVFVRQIVKN